MTDPAPTHALWDFSLAVYAHEPVRAECLGLQDTHGLDVNLLLAVAWIGACQRHELDAWELDTLRSTVAAWQAQVVAPLRQARRTARRTGPPPVADQIAAAELAAERVEQDRLFAAAASFAPGDADCVRRNIELLLAAHAVSASEFPAALATASSAYAGVRDGGTRLDRAARAD